MTAEVFIPFPGFYESWIDALIDDHIEQEADELDIEITPERYRINFEGVARAYVDLYEAQLEEALEAPPDSDLAPKFTFKKLISPRFYNFETDRILCEVDNVDKLMAVRLTLMGTDTLHQDIVDRFASRSGFASFYDDFVAGWKDKPFREWDCNELSILLPEFDMGDFNDPDLTTFREDIYNSVEVLEKEET